MVSGMVLKAITHCCAWMSSKKPTWCSFRSSTSIKFSYTAIFSSKSSLLRFSLQLKVFGYSIDVRPQSSSSIEWTDLHYDLWP